MVGSHIEVILSQRVWRMPSPKLRIIHPGPIVIPVQVNSPQLLVLKLLSIKQVLVLTGHHFDPIISSLHLLKLVQYIQRTHSKDIHFSFQMKISIEEKKVSCHKRDRHSR